MKNPFEQHFNRNPNRLHRQRPQSQLNQKVPKSEQKDNKHDDSKGLPNPTVKPKPKAKAKSPNEGTKGAGKGKGEEKGKDKSKEKKGAEAKPKAKANVPCLFYPKGTCNRGENCPFVHEQKPKTAVKAKPAAVPKAAVAFVVCASGVSQSSASEIHQHDSSRLKRSAWAIFKSSISAIVRPFATLLSLAGGCLGRRGFASLATLQHSSGVGVKDAFHHVPVILSNRSVVWSGPETEARNTPETDASFRVVQQFCQISQLCLHSLPMPVVMKLSGLQTVEPAETCVPKEPFCNKGSPKACSTIIPSKLIQQSLKQEMEHL